MVSNILLLGLRGSGKTTIGRMLAKSLNRRFVDLDERVLATFAETSVHDVWHAHGEDAWRDAERRTLETILDKASQVVALGGGTPMIESLAKRLDRERAAGRVSVVYLRCRIDELARRLARDLGDRPSLTGANVIEEIQVVLRQREPTYRCLADVELDVTSIAPASAVETLAELVGGYS